MRKITCLEVALLLLLISTVWGSPVPAGAQIFTNQQQPGISEEVQTPPKVWDPYQKTNEKIFRFNNTLYIKVVKPVSNVYTKLPASVRKVIRNGFQNLEDPGRFLNFVLQGRPRMAGDTMTRFILNSTVGIGGMFDVAHNALHLNRQDADFGQTLGVWGVHPGAYLVVPGLGPSDERDLFGFAVDSITDPLFWVPGPFWVTMPADALNYVNKASDHIDAYLTMVKASLDPYVAMRDGYMQYRENFIKNR